MSDQLRRCANCRNTAPRDDSLCGPCRDAADRQSDRRATVEQLVEQIDELILFEKRNEGLGAIAIKLQIVDLICDLLEIPNG